MLGYAGLAEYLGIGIRTAKRWVAEGILPRPDLRMRGVVRWRRETIEAWLVRQKRSPQ